MADTTSTAIEASWHAAFPKPTSSPDSVSKEQLLQWLKEGKQGGKDFVLVDLRKNDYEGGTIRGSINLPAQSLYPTIPYLYNLFSAAGTKKILWYCGSSEGRGSRAAAWFQDYLESQNDKSIQSLILTGGIKAWVSAGEEYISFVDGYAAQVWAGTGTADKQPKAQTGAEASAQKQQKALEKPYMEKRERRQSAMSVEEARDDTNATIRVMRMRDRGAN